MRLAQSRDLQSKPKYLFQPKSSNPSNTQSQLHLALCLPCCTHVFPTIAPPFFFFFFATPASPLASIFLAAPNPDAELDPAPYCPLAPLTSASTTLPTSPLTTSNRAATNGAKTCILRLPFKSSFAIPIFPIPSPSSFFFVFISPTKHPPSSYPLAANSSRIACRTRRRAHARTQLDLFRSAPVVTCHQSPRRGREACRRRCVSCSGCDGSDSTWLVMRLW